jgi:hypothetical protein
VLGSVFPLALLSSKHMFRAALLHLRCVCKAEHKACFYALMTLHQMPDSAALSLLLLRHNVVHAGTGMQQEVFA